MTEEETTKPNPEVGEFQERLNNLVSLFAACVGGILAKCEKVDQEEKDNDGKRSS